ncbi:hypothetical protein Droror1_Dr00016287 [Drosera rotundifolia]
MATALRTTTTSSSLFIPSLHLRPHRIPNHLLFPRFRTPFQIRVLGIARKGARLRLDSVCCVNRGGGEEGEGGDGMVVEEAVERPRFDINLAVILAGFAFEAYYTPPDNIGGLEMDGAGCKTAYLSKSFVREIYDGQLLVNLKKGFGFPAMDLWGTSDPYVVMQLGGQVCKSKVKWATIAPTWNEEFTFNTKQIPEESLQVAAWDANLVTPHKRLGNSAVNLMDLCDGNLHELLVELEGMGGGGKIQLEVKYKSFDEIDKEKEWWRVVPFVSEFLRSSGFESALQKLVGSETMQASQFVQFAFSQFKSLNDKYLLKELSPANSNSYIAGEGESGDSDVKSPLLHQNDRGGFSDVDKNGGDNIKLLEPGSSSDSDEVGRTTQSNMHFWKNFADAITQSVVQKLGIPVPEKMKWDGFELLNKIGLQMGRVAEAGYIESGLATPSTHEAEDKKEPETSPLGMEKIYSSLPDIKRAAEDLLTQTDSLFGGLMVMAAAVPRLKKEPNNGEADEIQEGGAPKPDDVNLDLVKSDQIEDLDEKRAEEMKTLFSTAESAMEAWAMLASSLGHPSFIKSEFEKLCFLDNSSTDTQVAIWRDSRRKRLVVAFRGTEQVRWKDLRTDLMLAPAGLNPERLGGNFKEEVQVHSGFLTAYDSVRTKILHLIQQAVGYRGDATETLSKWNVYVTGHSLGGALATLLALELSSSHLAKSRSGAISVTMYNFGSPRVGNRRFAEVYNEKVKDSWRVVNHRDIIPTVPRLMGYCHVAQPVYLSAGELFRTYENSEPLIDGYNGDVIGESTPDHLVSEFMRGEKEFIEKILQTEINIFRSIRDGTGLMQHMEDFYYISLLEKVRSNYRIDSTLQDEGDGFAVG